MSFWKEFSDNVRFDIQIPLQLTFTVLFRSLIELLAPEAADLAGHVSHGATQFFVGLALVVAMLARQSRAEDQEEAETFPRKVNEDLTDEMSADDRADVQAMPEYGLYRLLIKQLNDYDEAADQPDRHLLLGEFSDREHLVRAVNILRTRLRVSLKMLNRERAGDEVVVNDHVAAELNEGSDAPVDLALLAERLNAGSGYVSDAMHHELPESWYIRNGELAQDDAG